MALNVILGRVGQKGGVTLIADAPQVLKKTNNLAGSYTDCLSYLHQIEQGKESLPEVMFFYEANPVYALPQSGKMKEVLKEIPFKVTFSQFMDETAALCDLILPAPYFLERLDDSYAPFGVGQPTYSLTLPVVEPQANSKPTPEVVFSLAQQLSIDLGQNSFKEILKSKAQKLGADWKALNKGQTWVGKTDKTQPYLQIWSKTLAELAATAKNNGSDYPLSLTATANLKVGSKQVAIPPAGLHTLLENELQNGVFFVRINGKTARKHGLKQGMSISLQSPAGKCQARVDIFEGVMDDTVLAPLGFGHAAWDMFSRDKGDSVYKLLEVSEKGRSGLIQWADTRVKIAKI
jgi:anaerobic selenocysteine-containing dehydrogenase